MTKIIQLCGELEDVAKELFGFFMSYGRPPQFSGKTLETPVEWVACPLFWRERKNIVCGSLGLILVGLILPETGYVTVEYIFLFYNTFDNMSDEEIA